MEIKNKMQLFCTCNNSSTMVLTKEIYTDKEIIILQSIKKLYLMKWKDSGNI